MSLVRKLVFIIGGLLLTQSLSYLLLSKNFIHKNIISNHRFYVDLARADTIGLFNGVGKYEFSDRLLASNPGKANIIQIHDSEEWYVYRLSQTGNAGYFIEVEETIPFYWKVNEVVGASGYGEDWESHYVWVLFNWVKLKRWCTGQS